MHRYFSMDADTRWVVSGEIETSLSREPSSVEFSSTLVWRSGRSGRLVDGSAASWSSPDGHGFARLRLALRSFFLAFPAFVCLHRFVRSLERCRR